MEKQILEYLHGYSKDKNNTLGASLPTIYVGIDLDLISLKRILGKLFQEKKIKVEEKGGSKLISYNYETDPLGKAA